MQVDSVRGTRRVLTMAIVALFILAGVLLLRSRGTPPSPDPALVSWPVATPESEGFDPAALVSLADDLERRRTRALLVARHGQIVFEWYAPNFSAARPHYTASMAKGTAATPALLAAAGKGMLSLDDRVAEWIPAWTDSTHSRIRLRDLASHSSGLEHIEFLAGENRQLQGWRQYFYDHPEARFRLAIDSATTLFPPGTDVSYSGLGYYVLSYVVTRALEGRSADDLTSFLAEEVYEPLEIPAEAWSIGYERIDEVDGLPLTHFGSGGQITARAAARVGQLFLQRGCWNGRQLLEADLVDAALGRDQPIPAGSADREAADSAWGLGLGWWVNGKGQFPFASRAAAAAIGSGHQVTWIDPELDLVVVRLGRDLSERREPFYDALRRYVLEPLYAAVDSPPTSTVADAEDRPEGTAPARTSCPSMDSPGSGIRRAGSNG